MLIFYRLDCFPKNTFNPRARARIRNTFNSIRDCARAKRDTQNLRRAGEKNWQRYRGTCCKHNLNFFNPTTFNHQTPDQDNGHCNVGPLLQSG